MKIAVIDMGTNTFHLLLAQVTGESYATLHKTREVVRIGEQGLRDGWISLDAQTRTLNTLIKFKQLIEQEGVDKIYATATSAIRNAANGMDLIRMIKETTDIDVRIISGQEEATLIFGGVRKAVDLSKGSFLIMDIGGGSIEFIISKHGDVMWMESFEIGGQRLIDGFHDNDPITFDEIQNLEAFFEKSLKSLHDACEVFKPNCLVGASGTFDTLSDIYQKAHNLTNTSEDLPLDLDYYHQLHADLITLNREQRLAIPGMIEMRVDMIVVASVLISYVIRRYDLTDFKGSAFALKEGVLYDILDNLNSEKFKTQ